MREIIVNHGDGVWGALKWALRLDRERHHLRVQFQQRLKARVIRQRKFHPLVWPWVSLRIRSMAERAGGKLFEKRLARLTNTQKY